jgi:hypothetical protein
MASRVWELNAMVFRWVVTAAMIMPGLAFAQSLHEEADGDRMEIALPCVAEVDVTGTAALHGHAILNASAAHQEEIDQLVFLAGPRIRLRLRSGEAGDESCWRPPGAAGFTPSLKISLLVPDGFALAVDSAGAGRFRLGAGGPLNLELSGSPDVTVDTAKVLNLNMSGSARVAVRQIQGPVHAELSGSGNVRFGQVESDEVAIEQSGSADFLSETGSISTLSVQSSGSGTISIGGTVTNAVVESSGSGNVRLTRVTGRLVQDISGSGSVQVLAH